MMSIREIVHNGDLVGAIAAIIILAAVVTFLANNPQLLEGFFTAIKG